MLEDASNSAGFGGGVPAGIMKRLGRMGEVVMVCCMVALPVSTLLRPLRGPMPRVLWTLGRRKSASTSRTRTPFCASTMAVLMLVVVLPSWGRALVTMMTLGGAPRLESKSEVRSARYDSAICDCGRTWVTVSTASFDEVNASRFPMGPWLPDLEPRGIMPREGRADRAVACSGVRTVLSMFSSRKANPRPEMIPRTRAKDKLRGMLGSLG